MDDCCLTVALIYAFTATPLYTATADWPGFAKIELFKNTTGSRR